MPYIKRADRVRYEPYLGTLKSVIAMAPPGELAYVLFQVIRMWLGKDPNFSSFAKALGVLETTKLEVYRVLVTPYEDLKREENGDVP